MLVLHCTFAVFFTRFVPLWLLRTVPKQVFLRTIDVLEIKLVASIIGSLRGKGMVGVETCCLTAQCSAPVRVSVKKEQRVYAANRYCSHLKDISNCVGPAT